MILKIVKKDNTRRVVNIPCDKHWDVHADIKNGSFFVSSGSAEPISVVIKSVSEIIIFSSFLIDDNNDDSHTFDFDNTSNVLDIREKLTGVLIDEYNELINNS